VGVTAVEEAEEVEAGAVLGRSIMTLMMVVGPHPGASQAQVTPAPVRLFACCSRPRVRRVVAPRLWCLVVLDVVRRHQRRKWRKCLRDPWWWWPAWYDHVTASVLRGALLSATGLSHCAMMCWMPPSMVSHVLQAPSGRWTMSAVTQTPLVAPAACLPRALWWMTCQTSRRWRRHPCPTPHQPRCQ
jgi:hypothetical protein